MNIFGLVLFLVPFLPTVKPGEWPIYHDRYSPGRLAEQPYDYDLFTPLEDLSFISSDRHAVLTHPAFPRYGVRIKKSHEFCDPSVNSYTGYIDIEARHIFFYFFESRSDPDHDDVIFWTNGGGCTSAIGLFMELGPCKVKDGNTTVPNPESWNTNTNVFFVDQPVGTGFSYAEYGEEVSTTEEAAKDIASFVAIFFEHFVKFKGRAFHMAGESYAGRYLPIFASEIYDQNARLVEAGLTPINLQSVMIGNGLTDILTWTLSFYDFPCTPASIPPVLSISQCVTMKQKVPRCAKWMKVSCIDQFDKINCAAATDFCLNSLMIPYLTTGLNPYDISRMCEGGLAETLCYPLTKKIANYLDQPSLRSRLGVDPSNSFNFSTCNADMDLRFYLSLDFAKQTTPYVAALLDRGVRVLIYVGNYDWVSNWVGIERWTLALDWSMKDEFSSQKLRPWKVDGEKVGLTRSAGGFTFVTIEGAGHMAPYDKPRESLALVQRWLAKKEI